MTDRRNEKSTIWWTVVWPFKLHKMRKLWERGHIVMAENVLRELFNDKQIIAKSIIKYLSETHNWKIR